MKIAIIYTTLNSSTKKSCKILAGKLNADVQRIPIEMAKKDCVLKYNFIILAGSAVHGRVQGELKRYISQNLKTLNEKPHALILNGEDEKDIYNKTFTEKLVNSSFMNSNFGYELNPDDGNIIDKRLTKRLTEKLKKQNRNLPSLNLQEIDNFSEKINNMIEKRVD